MTTIDCIMANAGLDRRHSIDGPGVFTIDCLLDGPRPSSPMTVEEGPEKSVASSMDRFRPASMAMAWLQYGAQMSPTEGYDALQTQAISHLMAIAMVHRAERSLYGLASAEHMEQLALLALFRETRSP